MKGFNPIVRYNDCSVISRIENELYTEIRLPINKNLRFLEMQKTPIISDITPIWFRKNKSKLSAMLDLESNGAEVTEIGIIIYNKYRIVWIYHRIFKTRSETLPGLEKFVHQAAQTPSEFFDDVRSDIVTVLNLCSSIVVKGSQLEASIFPELAYKIVDLNIIDSFPKIDSVDSSKIFIAYNIIKPYLMLTQKQHNDIIDIRELRHNPMIECYIFWFILNNINPNILYNLVDIFNFKKLHILS